MVRPLSPPTPPPGMLVHRAVSYSVRLGGRSSGLGLNLVPFSIPPAIPPAWLLVLDLALAPGVSTCCWVGLACKMQPLALPGPGEVLAFEAGWPVSSDPWSLPLCTAEARVDLPSRTRGVGRS